MTKLVRNAYQGVQFGCGSLCDRNVVRELFSALTPGTLSNICWD